MRTYTEQLSFIPGWLIDANHATYFLFLSGFYITLNKGRKCTSQSLFESKEYSIGKKCNGL